jgi:hypothetical protein
MRTKTTRTAVIGMLGFDEANALDVTGPLESVLERERSRAPSRREREPYELALIGLRRVPFSADRACLSTRQFRRRFAATFVQFYPHCSALRSSRRR